MNPPIKAHPAQAPRPPAPERPVSKVAESRPAPSPSTALPMARRGEPERLRSSWNTPPQDTALGADSALFSQLLITPVGAEPDQSGYGGSGFAFPVQADGVPTQLIDELAQRLPDQPDGPFNVTLLMPNLGKVQVNANKRDNQWTVELAFARRGVLRRVQPHQNACRDALAEALGQDVELSLHEDLNA